jgi:NAD(P)H dehydrogenase (quinone)
MKVLVIYAHPSSKSFNHALLESFTEGLKKAKHEFEVLDLYKERFNPVVSEAEIEAHSKTGVHPDIVVYQQKIKAADCLAFVFPTYWFRGPAMLEGFIDRVFTAGFAFKYVKSMPKGLLPDKKAVVIQTYGGPGFYYQLLMHRIPWRRFKSVLTFCGIKKIIHQPCYNVPFTTDKVRQKYLAKVKGIGMGLK